MTDLEEGVSLIGNHLVEVNQEKLSEKLHNAHLRNSSDLKDILRTTHDFILENPITYPCILDGHGVLPVLKYFLCDFNFESTTSKDNIQNILKAQAESLSLAIFQATLLSDFESKENQEYAQCNTETISSIINKFSEISIYILMILLTSKNSKVVEQILDILNDMFKEKPDSGTISHPLNHNSINLTILSSSFSFSSTLLYNLGTIISPSSPNQNANLSQHLQKTNKCSNSFSPTIKQKAIRLGFKVLQQAGLVKNKTEKNDYFFPSTLQHSPLVAFQNSVLAFVSVVNSIAFDSPMIHPQHAAPSFSIISPNPPPLSLSNNHVELPVFQNSYISNFESSDVWALQTLASGMIPLLPKDVPYEIVTFLLKEKENLLGEVEIEKKEKAKERKEKEKEKELTLREKREKERERVEKKELEKMYEDEKKVKKKILVEKAREIKEKENLRKENAELKADLEKGRKEFEAQKKKFEDMFKRVEVERKEKDEEKKQKEDLRKQNQELASKLDDEIVLKELERKEKEREKKEKEEISEPLEKIIKAQQEEIEKLIRKMKWCESEKEDDEEEKKRLNLDVEKIAKENEELKRALEIELVEKEKERFEKSSEKDEKEREREEKERERKEKYDERELKEKERREKEREKQEKMKIRKERNELQRIPEQKDEEVEKERKEKQEERKQKENFMGNVRIHQKKIEELKKDFQKAIEEKENLSKQIICKNLQMKKWEDEEIEKFSPVESINAESGIRSIVRTVYFLFAVGKDVQSEITTAYGAKWYLHVGKEEPRKKSAYLYCKSVSDGEIEKKEIYYRYSIIHNTDPAKNLSNVRCLHNFTKESNGWGRSNFIDVDDLKINFSQDGICKAQLEFIEKIS